MRTGAQRGGFTLIEVVMALAISVTTILVLLALLPETADSIGDSHMTGKAKACVELVLADVRSAGLAVGEGEQIVTPEMDIVFPNAGESVVRTVFFDGDGQPSDEASAKIRVSLHLRRGEPESKVMTIDCEARWPAAEGAVRPGSLNVWGVRTL